MKDIKAHTDGPSDLDIVQSYIISGKDILATAAELGVDIQRVASAISTPGAIMALNHTSTNLISRMEDLFQSAIRNLEEAEVGLTAKDPAEVLAMMHKMKMEELKMQIKLAEVQAGKGPNKVSNTQVNIGSEMLHGLPAILQAIREE